jgi:DNA-binding CsgD family transcriptional regulator
MQHATTSQTVICSRPLSAEHDPADLPTLSAPGRDVAQEFGGAVPCAEPGMFIAALDAMGPGLLFFDLAQRQIHANETAARMLGSGADHGWLRDEVQVFVDFLYRLVRSRRDQLGSTAEDVYAREICTSEQRYLLRGSLVPLNKGQGFVLVALEPVGTPADPDGQLRTRFGLTGKEIQVARLMAEGKTNKEIAKTLYISPHTARHHTERILRKVGAHSRTEAVGKLLRECGESSAAA